MRFKVGDNLIKKTRTFQTREIVGITGRYYLLRRTNNDFMKNREFRVTIRYVNNNYELHTKLVLDTPISRTFYKGQFTEENGKLRVKV